MINLNDMLQGAQGGQAIDNLAARFGLPPEQARSAVEALLPALQMGLQNKIADGGLGSLIGAAAGVHRQAYADADAAQSTATEQHGRSVLGGLFGGAGATTSVAQQAAAQSGVPASVIQAMLPVIASMITGGLLQHAGGGAWGGILSSVLGSFLGQGATASPPIDTPSAPASGGFGGAVGTILGGLFGGSHDAGAPPSIGPAPTTTGDPTLDEISNMITAGTPPAPDHEAALAGIVRR